MRKTCSIPHLGRMVLLEASSRRYLERLEDNPWGSGVGDTKDPRPVTPQLHLVKATRLVNARGSTSVTGSAQSEPPHIADTDKVPVARIRNMLGKNLD